jgi:hypothetical protein
MTEATDPETFIVHDQTRDESLTLFGLAHAKLFPYPKVAEGAPFPSLLARYLAAKPNAFGA